MQITSGLISIDTGVSRSLVTGNSSVDWTQVLVTNLIVISGKVFQITSVNAVDKTLTISPEWPDSTISGSSYAIVRDFTANHSLPMLNAGDLEAASIFTRAIERVDSLLGTSGSTTNEILVSVGSATSFIVGNLVGFSASGWFLCDSSSIADSIIVGCVTFVATDGLSFKIKTEGRITGITGITLTLGSTYYLRNSPVSGGGGQVNITAVTGEAGSLLVPVMIADSTSSGYLLNLATTQSAVFSSSSNGLVPSPGSSTGLFLKDDATWAAVTVADDSLVSTQFSKTGSVNWTQFLADATGLSVYNHIKDLQSRLALVEAAGDFKRAYTRNVYSWESNSSGTWTDTVPQYASFAIVTIISASNYVQWFNQLVHYMHSMAFTASGKSSIVSESSYPALANAIRIKVPTDVAGGTVLSGVLGDRGSFGASVQTTLKKDGVDVAHIHAPPSPPLVGETTPLFSVASGYTEIQFKSFTPSEVMRLVYANPSATANLDSAAQAKKFYGNATGGQVYCSRGLVVVEYGIGTVLGI